MLVHLLPNPPFHPSAPPDRRLEQRLVGFERALVGEIFDPAPARSPARPPAPRPHRLVAQDAGLSRRKQGFEPPWGRQRGGMAARKACPERSRRSLCARARAGELADFTGVSAPCEATEAPDLVADTVANDVETCVGLLFDYAMARIGGEG